MADSITLIVVFSLALVGGFAARRGSICLVRATSEISYGKPPKTLVFIAEASVVALAVTAPAFLLFPDYIHLATSYRISASLLLGCVAYGLGVALNGGCALGTLNQLVAGDFNYLGTLVGIAIGLYWFLSFDQLHTLQNSPVDAEHFQGALFLVSILLVVWALVLFKAREFLKSDFKLKAKRFVHASTTRDFVAVSLLGVSSGLLYVLFGHSWDYTRWLLLSEELLLKSEINVAHFLSLSAAVFGAIVGIAIATLKSASFRAVAMKPQLFIFRILGGTLMGLGAMLIPGGNDTLIVYSLPGLALHAPLALIMIMLTIGIVLKLSDKELFPLIWRE